MTASHQAGAGDAGRMTGWVGWVLFAAVILFVGGAVNIIEGLVALFKNDYYEVRPSGLVVHINYTSWGWTLLAVGIVLVVVGYGVATGRVWAGVTAVVLACLNAVMNLAFIPAYPVWAILAIALDVMVVYAIVVHGREARALRR